jgi:hypothetical protein
MRSSTKESAIDPCCQAEQTPRKSPATCSACGNKGSKVGEITLNALLRPSALTHRAEKQHWFCGTAACPVVYFGREERFNRENIIVPVFEKENDTGCLVCYCFDVSENDIRDEIAMTGKSTASNRIRKFIRQGRCACELKRPQGSCCLGSVAALERRLVRSR